MRFHEFLRTTVLMSAGSATALALVTLATGGGRSTLIEVAIGWWLLGWAVGLWVGRESHTSQAIASLLAAARSQRSLPEVTPARTVLNRLWPLMFVTVVAVGIGLVEPQIPAIAAGFAIVWSLAWRRQASAVKAIEDRDGARFYVDQTSPLSPIRLVRTPGFRTNVPKVQETPPRTAQSPP